jgi:hypothetical protein
MSLHPFPGLQRRFTMKKLLLALLATSTLAVAAPALAHDEGDDDWSAPSYSDFDQQHHPIWDGIQYGLSDGSYTPWQARRFSRELQSIRARAWWEQSRGYYDPEDTDARLESLHTRMHIAHDQGHERLNNDWHGYSGQYGGYGDYGSRW